MKKVLLALLIFFCLSIPIKSSAVFAECNTENLSDDRLYATQIKENRTDNTNLQVQHFFIHELIYDFEKTLSSSKNLQKCFDLYHLTTFEFRKILEELYNKNFILVNLEDVYEEVNGKLQLRKDCDFGNKQPLLLSFDDLTYDTKNRGIVEKIITKDREIFDYTECEPQQFSQERDGITILENFIKEHQDFSFNNARATLCVNGYNGIFGYRIHSKTHLKGEALEKEKQELSSLIKILKEKGYRFACHSYNHCSCAYINYSNLVKDLQLWNSEILPFVGETKIYCYPCGDHRCGSPNNQYLKDNGFNIFFCVGRDLKKKNEISEKDAIYLYRFSLDGRTLRTNQKEYLEFFDTEKVYDSSRSLPFSYKY